MPEPRIASGSLIPYLKAAQHLGVDITCVSNELGLDPDSIYENQLRIPVSSSMHILKRLIELTHSNCFGLHSAKNTDMSSYDINGYISLNCSSPLEAMELTANYYGIISDHRVLYVSEVKKHIISQWHLSDSHDTVLQNAADHLLGSYCKFAKDLMGLDGAVAYATFKHSAPTDSETRQLFEEVFNCPLLFDQPQYSIAIDREKAHDTHIPQADTVLRDILISHADTRLKAIRQTPPFTFQVKEVIKQILLETTPSRERVAERLHMGSRTLQRHLLSEGSSYKDAFNEVRCDLAIHYIRLGSLPLDDIAEKLGFSETRSFHRSFKQWTGLTIGAYRAQLTH